MKLEMLLRWNPTRGRVVYAKTLCLNMSNPDIDSNHLFLECFDK